LATFSGAWQVYDQAARRTETERTVMAALAEAETLNSEGWKQIDDPDRWRATVLQAQSALQRAEGLLATGVATDELAGRVHAVRAVVDEAARASTLRSELDRIRLEEAGRMKQGRYFDLAAAAPLYGAAFRAYGIEPSAASAEMVQASPLREILLTAL